MTDLIKMAGNQMTSSIVNIENESDFNRQLIHDNAMANNSYKDERFDLDREKQSSKDALAELNANNGLQSMLAAQMLSVHKLQQKSMCYA